MHPGQRPAARACRLLAAAAALVVLPGCAPGSPHPGPSDEAPSCTSDVVLELWDPPYEAEAEAPGRDVRPMRVPADFGPAHAVRCDFSWTVLGGEVLEVSVHEVWYSGDLEALVTALAQPSATPRPEAPLSPADPACGLPGLPPALWLVDEAGRSVLTAVPTDARGCHAVDLYRLTEPLTEIWRVEHPLSLAD